MRTPHLNLFGPKERPRLAGKTTIGMLLPRFVWHVFNFRNLSHEKSDRFLGLLAGAALARGSVRDYGYFFLAIDPRVMGPMQSFEEQMTNLVTDIKGARRQPDTDEVRIPFERASRERERRRHEGIVLDRKIVDAIKAIAAGET